MTYQLVNILEYIIPDAVEAEIHRHDWDSQIDEPTKQRIVLGVLNHTPPCYQLLPPELLVCESRTMFPANLDDDSAKVACSRAVKAMLPSHLLQQLQTTVATEIAEQAASILTH